MTSRSRVSTAVALALACAAAWFAAPALELRLGPELMTQPWRLWTSHFVHASPAHFAFNVAAGAALVALGAPVLSFGWLAPLVAIAVALSRPDLATYVGLSGVLHGWVLLTLPPGRAQTTLAAVVLAKIGLELLAGTTSLASFDLGAEPVAQAHAAGALAALASRAIERETVPIPTT